MLEPATTVRSRGASKPDQGSSVSHAQARKSRPPPRSRQRRSVSSESGSTAASGGIRPAAIRLSSTTGAGASVVYAWPSKRSISASGSAGGS